MSSTLQATVFVLGLSNTGKSALLAREVQKEFFGGHDATERVEGHTWRRALGEQAGALKMHGWEVPMVAYPQGLKQETYSDMVHVLLVLSFDDLASFQALDLLAAGAREAHPSATLWLVANKRDVDEAHWRVSEAEVEAKAVQMGLEMAMISCAEGGEGGGVDALFARVAEACAAARLHAQQFNPKFFSAHVSALCKVASKSGHLAVDGKDRFCVLADATLHQFASTMDSEGVTVDVVSCTVTGTQDPETLQIITPNRSLALRAPNAEEAVAWLEVLRETQAAQAGRKTVGTSMDLHDGVIKGPLKIQGKLGRWLARHAEVSQGFLKLYKKKEDSMANEVLDLLTCSLREVDGKRQVFELISLNGSRVFQAPDDVAYAKWTVGLHVAIQAVVEATLGGGEEGEWGESVGTPSKSGTGNSSSGNSSSSSSSSSSATIECEMEGAVWKRSEHGQWQERYARLVGENLLLYREAKATTASKCIGLLLCSVRLGDGQHGREHALEVVSPSRTYELAFDTRVDLQRWVEVLSAATVRLMEERLASTLTRRRNTVVDGDGSAVVRLAKSVEPAEGWEERVAAVRAMEGNEACCDCRGTDGVTWASITHGILLCAACAGIHRSLGTHVSQVRSLDLDVWTESNLEAMEVGNTRANEIWEARMSEEARLGSDVDMDARKEFIRRKYVELEWFGAQLE